MKSAISCIADFALARSLSLREPGPRGRSKYDPRDSVVKDLTASRWSKHRVTDLGDLDSSSYGPGGGTCERFRIEKHLTCFGHFLLNHLQA